MNHELNQLIQGADIVRFVKSRRLEWLGHVRRMDSRRIAKRIADSRPVRKRITGRPRKRWLDDVEDDFEMYERDGMESDV